MIELGKGKADRDGQCREKTSKCEQEWGEGETIAFKNDKKVPICMSCALSLVSRDRAVWAKKQETRTEARESYTLNHGDAAIETLLQSIAQSLGTIASEMTAIREHIAPTKPKPEEKRPDNVIDMRPLPSEIFTTRNGKYKYRFQEDGEAELLEGPYLEKAQEGYGVARTRDKLPPARALEIATQTDYTPLTEEQLAAVQSRYRQRFGATYAKHPYRED